MAEGNVWNEFDDLLSPILDEIDTDPSDTDFGDDVSPIPEIKIIFDGFGYNEETDEDDNDSEMSYSIIIHRDSHKEGFSFPEHDSFGNSIIHRPNSERCFTVWYHVNEGTWETTTSPEDPDTSELKSDEIIKILRVLRDRYYK